MKVIICGAGQVGYGIAERLCRENNDVAVIDKSAELITRINDTLDVRGITGHGADPNVLDEAGARDADMIVAVTYSDEVNMVACQVAHSLFDIPTKIARVRTQSYLQPHWQDLFSRDHLPIDVIISPEIAVGKMVLQRLGLPGAFETVQFCDGKVNFIGLNCQEDCPVINTPLRQLSELFNDLNITVVGIVRDNKLIVPHSGDSLLVNDDVYFVVNSEEVGRALKIFGHQSKSAQRIIIAGGGNISLYLAQELEKTNRNIRVKIIEINRERAVQIAQHLERTVVLHGNALDEEILKEAEIANCDAMLSLTNDDQVNILVSILARSHGSSRNLCLINQLNYMTIVNSLGIGEYVNPRAITVSSILQHVRKGRIRGVHSVFNGHGEVIEAEALDASPMVGVPLRDLNLPEGIRIGAIMRKGEIIFPNGDTEIALNDRIVIFALSEHISSVEQMFRVSLEYF